MKRALLLSLVIALPPRAVSGSETDLSHRGTGVQRMTRPQAATPPRHHGATSDARAAQSNACLALLPADPSGAADDARDWSAHGGGDAAAQCAALADVALGDPDSGAESLDRLAAQATIAMPRRAMLADEASRAWMEAGHPDRALRSAAMAVSLAPGDPDWLTDRARAALATGHAALAVADLSEVLAAHPGQSDARVVRSTAYRTLNRIAEARADIDAACAAMPDAPDALLERGIVRQQLGDLEGARRDWSRVLSVSPDTHEADLAEQDLALLDVGPEAR